MENNAKKQTQSNIHILQLKQIEINDRLDKLKQIFIRGLD